MRGRALTLTALASLVLAAPASAAPGSFTTTEVFGGFGATAVAIGDFDGENGPDLAIADKNTGGVSILLNKGDARPSTPRRSIRRIRPARARAPS